MKCENMQGNTSSYTHASSMEIHERKQIHTNDSVFIQYNKHISVQSASNIH